MGRAFTVCLLAAACATSAPAQSGLRSRLGLPAHYDLYYVLPAEAGSLGAEVGLNGVSLRDLGDSSLVPVVVKASVSDQVEVGARARLGFLHGTADDLSAVEVGAKVGLGPNTALTAAALLPVGDAESTGLSLGAMGSLTSGELVINHWLQVGLLDGYAGGAGADLALLVEPSRAFGDRVTCYVDVLASTNTDGLGDRLAIDLGPNVDLMLSDRAVVNAGVTLGLAGDLKQDDPGLIVTLITRF